MLVLVADDLKANQALLESLVLELGHEVIIVEDGSQAVEAVKQHQPQLILMDITMPVMDGLQAIAAIRKLKGLCWIPIIVISSSDKPENIVKGIEIGADDYLTIPFVAEIVQAKIKAMARLKKLSDDNLELMQEREQHHSQVLIDSERYQQLKDVFNKSAIIAEVDVQGNITHVNDKFCALSGYNEQELLGQNHRILRSGIHTSEFYKDLWRTISNGKVWNGDICNKSKDGGLYWVRTTIVPFFESGTNKITKYLAIRFDITDKKMLEAILEKFRIMYEQSPIGIALIDSYSGKIIEVNSKFADIAGRTRKEMAALDWMSITHPDDVQEDLDNMALLNAGDISEFKMQKRYRLPNKSYVWINMKIAQVSVADNERSRHLCMIEDITENKRHEQELHELAHYDSLTKLPNHVLFSKRYSDAVDYMQHSDTVLAVCIVDLDNFKAVNDTYGRDIGDTVLIQVAVRINSCIRDEDTVSRQGGDEFALLLGDMATTIECKELLSRVLQVIAEPYLIDGNSIKISASGGISIYPLDNSEIDTVLRHTDQAMYQAKLAGRNGYHLFNAADAKKNSDKHIRLQEIKQALKNEELHLYYQPKVNMKTGTAFGVEALIRWIHPTKGIIPPLDFLPLIEGTPIEIDVGNWVVNEALKQTEQWKAQGLDLEVSINVSCYHLLSPDFVNNLGKFLKLHASVDPRYIQLEILESSVLSDISAIDDILQICKDKLSVQVALDDFGTGYSSLTHLRYLSADTVKIDQSFVRTLLDDPGDYAVIDSVIRLSEAFEREVIAEGVETIEQGIMLMAIGCNEAQGYGIARPMPAAEIISWFDHYTPNKKWLDYGREIQSGKARTIIIIMLTTEQWIKSLEGAINDNNNDYEITRCHLGNWLANLRKDSIFSDKKMNKIEHVHDLLFSLGDSVIGEYRARNLKSMNRELRQLKATLNTLQEVLDNSE